MMLPSIKMYIVDSIRIGAVLLNLQLFDSLYLTKL